MKKFILFITLFLCPTAVIGAELPNLFSYASSSASLNNRWTSCYLGLNVGVGWEQSQDTIGSGDVYKISSGGGALGGGQVGCDYQINKWLLGVQAMFDGTSLNGKKTFTPFETYPTETLNAQPHWLVTLTGRLGYTFNSELLAYVKGGAAWENIDYYVSGISDPPDGSVPFSVTAGGTFSGWTVGGGLEKALNDKTSLFVEYNYTDLGPIHVTYSGDYPTSTLWTDTWKHQINSVIFGLNFKFY